MSNAMKIGDRVTVGGMGEAVVASVPPDKLTDRTRLLAKFARDAMADGASEAEVYSILADSRNALNRARKRAKESPGFERIEIAQMHGPTVEMNARLLCDTSFEDRRERRTMTLELYETQGGAMVAVSAYDLGREDGQESQRATVIPPTSDVQAMRFAVMEAFNWHTEARRMVSKKLGWSLRMEVA